MLPMILSFLGSAFAPSIAAATGIGALASPLLTGAIGSGLGTLAQGGSPGDALRSGLGSFVGGKLVGGLMGSTAGAPTAPNMAQARAAGMGPLAATAPPVRPAGLGADPLSGQGIKAAFNRGMDFAMSPTGIGSMVGSALATPQPTVRMDKKEDSDAKKEMKPIPRQMLTPPEGYRPGIDGEFDYGISTPRSYEDILAYRDRGVLPYAEGGEVKQPNEKTEIVEAVAAIKNQHPQPEIALGKFLAKYGEEALRDLVESVRSGEFDETRERFANGENGVVRGPGDGSGVDDKVPANIDGEQDVLLSDGEFVLRKDATDALEKMFGGGFLSAVNSAGEAAPKVLKQKVAA